MPLTGTALLADQARYLRKLGAESAELWAVVAAMMFVARLEELRCV